MLINRSRPFFILQVYDGRRNYSFGLGLTDEALAKSMLDSFASDLLGRVIELVSLDEMPQEFGDAIQHVRHTVRIRELFEQCQIESNVSRAFLVAYVETFKACMPLRQVGEMLGHAKYEPDFDEHVFIPIHQSAIGRAYP